MGISNEKHLPVITQFQLQQEAIQLVVGQGVIDTLRDYDWNPENIAATENASWKNAIMCNPCSELHGLFKGFDSHFHSPAFNQKHFYFQMYKGDYQPLGTEINYYFQGILFRIFKLGLDRTKGFVLAWKIGAGHGDFNDNIDFFLELGWMDLPALWPRMLQAQKTQEQAQARGDVLRIRHQIHRQKFRLG